MELLYKYNIIFNKGIGNSARADKQYIYGTLFVKSINFILIIEK